MKIEIVDIKDRGDKSKERLVIKALTDLDVGYYIVFLTKKIGDESFSSIPDRVFWFPDKRVKEGDLVVLYSKSGTNSIKENKSGNTTHFFYWNLPSTVFEDDKKIPVIIEANGWT